MAWWQDAACASADPELFFSNENEINLVEKAKQVCRNCLVRQTCFFEGEGKPGIFGGFTQSERQKMDLYINH